MALFGRFSRNIRQRVKPTDVKGSPGTGIIGGYIQSGETDPRLTENQKYRIFADALLNVPIVSASVQHIIKILGASKWTFTPSPNDIDGVWASRCQEMLTKDPDQPWSEVVKSASTYSLYGFALLEWTVVKKEDGSLTFAEIAARPQATIERWDRVKGKVEGVYQRVPSTGTEEFIPRWKTMYIREGALTDNPAGLGLFRQLVESVRRLNAYMDVLHNAFDGDLRGIPIGRVPFIELAKAVQNNEITQEDMDNAVEVMNKFIGDRSKKKPSAGITLDSSTYTTADAANRPGTTPKFGIDLLKGGSDSIPDLIKMIEETKLDIARIMGTELIILGNGAGSHALSEDKASRLSLMIDDTLRTIGHAVNKDLIDTLWSLNGFPQDMKPTAEPEASKYVTVESITGVLTGLTSATGVPMDVNDPAINEVRALVGVSPIEASDTPPTTSEGDDS